MTGRVRRRPRSQGGWLFLGPPAVIIAAFILLPLFDLITLSFERWNGLGPRTYVGTRNFETLLSDDRFWAALRNNIVFSLGTCWPGRSSSASVSPWRSIAVSPDGGCTRSCTSCRS